MDEQKEAEYDDYVHQMERFLGREKSSEGQDEDNEYQYNQVEEGKI